MRKSQLKSSCIWVSDNPRTIKVRDFKACAAGMVEICSNDFTEIYYGGSVDAIPFVYLDCWIVSLNVDFHSEDNDSVCPYFIIQLES